MTYDDLIIGLKFRGFSGTDDVMSRGKCHKDEKHYILYTDGLIIYSNTRDYHNDDNPQGLYEDWPLEQSDYDIKHNIKEFSFEDLDQIMTI